MRFQTKHLSLQDDNGGSQIELINHHKKDDNSDN